MNERADTTALPRLVPPKVTWQINVLKSYFSLVHHESPADGPTCLQFQAFSYHADTKQFTHDVIELSFDDPRGVRVNPPWEGDFVIDFDSYDRSELPAARPGAEFGESIRQEQRTWQASGVCPDPGFYLVQRSSWHAAVLDAYDHADVYHYLAVGRSCSIDILAKGWSWRVLRTLGIGPPLGYVADP